MEDVEAENRLNAQIEDALSKKDIRLSTDLCVGFLEQVYGAKAVKFWALRDFAEHLIKNGSKSRFDKNVLELFALRQERIEGYAPKPKYVSPYFDDECVEELDGIYEDYLERSIGGRHAKNKFLKFIKNAVEGLPLL